MKTPSKIVISALLGAALVACAGYMEKVEFYQKPWVEQLPASADESAAMNKALATGNKFSIPKDQANDAWGRAQAFVSKHSSLKLQQATDFVIETYNPTERGEFGYAISRTPLGDNHEFEVKCATGERIKDSIQRDPKNPTYTKLTPKLLAKARQDCVANAVIAGHFIKTGELACERCIAKGIAPHDP